MFQHPKYLIFWIITLFSWPSILTTGKNPVDIHENASLRYFPRTVIRTSGPSRKAGGRPRRYVKAVNKHFVVEINSSKENFWFELSKEKGLKVIEYNSRKHFWLNLCLKYIYFTFSIKNVKFLAQIKILDYQWLPFQPPELGSVFKNTF